MAFCLKEWITEGNLRWKKDGKLKELLRWTSPESLNEGKNRVYCIVSLVSEDWYIGSTRNTVWKRWLEHLRDTERV
jgi:hypothetical protein